MDAITLKNLVEKAINRLISNDKDLLQNDVNERSITHRFACYLQELFHDHGWNVDCEYNKNHDQTKKLMGYRRKTVAINDTQGTSVFPDIIVHRRMRDNNLLVIEVKKSTNNEPDKLDLEKLSAFKQELKYTYALFLRLETGDQNVGVKEKQWV
jgi:hypothetical protein